MSLARWEETIVDSAGNILPGATVTVRLESTGNLAALKSDRAGAVGMANPFTADAVTAKAAFHVVGGAYRITVTSGPYTDTKNYQAIGTAAETDAPVGVTRMHTTVGDATIGAVDEFLIIKKGSPAPTSVIIPAAADRNGVAIFIKDGTGDADLNPITPVFNGSEGCDGVTNADSPELQIRTPYGFLWMKPLPDGSGYFQLPSQL